MDFNLSASGDLPRSPPPPYSRYASSPPGYFGRPRVISPGHHSALSAVDLRDLGKVKFKRSGASRSGITLCDAQSDMLLSGQYSYTLSHLSVNHMKAKLFVNIRLHGYSPLNYEVPVDSYNDLVDLNSLARRIGRAVGHYLQINAIHVPWDRVEIQYLEEVAFETWCLRMRIL